MKKSFLVLSAIIASLGLVACGENSSSGGSNSSNGSNGSLSPSISVIEDDTIKGAGTKESPFLVSNQRQLKKVANACLGSDITLYISIERNFEITEEWAPLGTLKTPFSANIIGNGHTIKGLNINAAGDEQQLFGLFGCYSGVVENLTVEGNIDIQQQIASSYVGLFAGVTYNAYLKDVTTKGKIVVRNNTEVDDLTSCVGGVSGANVLGDKLTSTFEEVSFFGDIDCRVKDANVAGILGCVPNVSLIQTSSLLITNSYVESSQIKGGNITAGLVGNLDAYTGITNSIVKVDKIEAIDSSEGAYVGGITAAAYYETALINNVVLVNSLKAPSSPSPAYSSHAGVVTGRPVEDGYDEYSNELGSAIYGNGFINPIIEADTTLLEQGETIEAKDVDSTYLIKHGFNRAWKIDDGKAVLKAAKDISSDEVDVIINKNDGSGDSKTVKVEPNTIAVISENDYKRDGYLNYGLYYDKEATVAYRFYAPVNSGLEVNCGWFDTSRLAGFYKGASSVNGTIQFMEDGTFVWLMSDLYSSIGTWWCDGKHLIYSHLFLNDVVCIWDEANGKFTFPDANDDSYSYTFTKAGKVYGYWSNEEGRQIFLNDDGTGSYSDGDTVVSITYSKVSDTELKVNDFGAYGDCKIVIANDGSITFSVVEDYEYSYNWKLVKGSAVPNYENKKAIGKYKGNFAGCIDLLNNGNFEYRKISGDTVYAYGGFRIIDSTTVQLKSSAVSIFNGIFKFDASTNTLISADGTKILAKEGEYVNSFMTSDKSVIIHVFDNKTYLVMNGKLNKSTTISGDLVDGNTITIGKDEYKIEGTTLKYISKDPDKTPLVNTYIDANTKIELALNADGTGTYDGSAINYTFDGTKVKFTVNSLLNVELTWNASDKTLIGTADDSESPVNLSFTVKKEVVEEKNLIGTWSGNGIMSNTYTITIKADKTYSMKLPAGTFDGTWTGSLDGKIELDTTPISSIFDSCSITYQASSDTIKVEWEDYDYNPGSAVWTRVA